MSDLSALLEEYDGSTHALNFCLLRLWPDYRRDFDEVESNSKPPELVGSAPNLSDWTVN